MRWMILFLLAALVNPGFAQDTGPAADSHGVPTDLNTILQLQIFLDRHMFGPGKLDGAVGEFTYKAVVNYNFAHGNRDLYDWQPVLTAAAQEVPVVYAAFKIRTDLEKFVNPQLPEKPEDQVSHPYMAYRSWAELVAERFHTDETFLAKCNPNLKLTALKPGDVVMVPNVRSFRIEEVKAMQSFPKDATLSLNTIVVDTTERIAAVYDPGERLLAAFPITPGKPEFIPVGTWSVKTIMTTPSFRYDKQFLEEGVRGKEAYQLPPGPNSPVGIIWCGLSKSGIGLHGTALPRTIGRSRSAGCVRLANWDAIRLPQLVRPSSPVIVR
ncbi:L,D-transpeptidase catalytic domain [Prosthecobacter debontii]|uniref:L,D-transpeptidase catalytic domain n=2 Tax=Prosthecobacter debontii TaxID=48467 RepID=A0A1T4WL37_9BACT|nr:L,D-transpeptidase catalytic domain [Prosthecobacter debontii]